MLQSIIKLFHIKQVRFQILFFHVPCPFQGQAKTALHYFLSLVVINFLLLSPQFPVRPTFYICSLGMQLAAFFSSGIKFVLLPNFHIHLSSLYYEDYNCYVSDSTNKRMFFLLFLKLPLSSHHYILSIVIQNHISVGSVHLYISEQIVQNVLPWRSECIK